MKLKQKKPKKPFMSGYKTYDTASGFGSQSEWRSAWNERMDHNEATSTLERDDPLQVLGFSVMPSRNELDRRYRELVKVHHPDMGGNAKEFIKIQAAWSLLIERL